MFSKKGVIVFDEEKHGEDEVMEIALEAGAEDVAADAGEIEVTTAPQDFETVRTAFEEKKLRV